MRVQQDGSHRQPFSHSPDSLKFTISPLILTTPFQLPRKDFAGAESGETFAIGRPRFVIIKVLPLATSSSNPRHLALNSLAPNVDSFMALLSFVHYDQSTGQYTNKWPGRRWHRSTR